MKTNICVVALLLVSMSLFGQANSTKKLHSSLPDFPRNAKIDAEMDIFFAKYVELCEDFTTQFEVEEEEIENENEVTWFTKEVPLVGNADKFSNTKYRILAFELNKTMKKGLIDLTTTPLKR